MRNLKVIEGDIFEHRDSYIQLRAYFTKKLIQTFSIGYLTWCLVGKLVANFIDFHNPFISFLALFAQEGHSLNFPFY